MLLLIKCLRQCSSWRHADKADRMQCTLQMKGRNASEFSSDTPPTLPAWILCTLYVVFAVHSLKLPKLLRSLPYYSILSDRVFPVQKSFSAILFSLPRLGHNFPLQKLWFRKYQRSSLFFTLLFSELPSASVTGPIWLRLKFSKQHRITTRQWGNHSVTVLHCFPCRYGERNRNKT